MKEFSRNKIAEIKRIVGRDKVLLGLSGGVDSSVVAKLLDMAIGATINLYLCGYWFAQK